jgi:hypothetical protein
MVRQKVLLLQATADAILETSYAETPAAALQSGCAPDFVCHGVHLLVPSQAFFAVPMDCESQTYFFSR